MDAEKLPLHGAILNPTANLRSLLKKSADVNAKDANGRTALYLAASAGVLKHCDTLLNKKWNAETHGILSLLAKTQGKDPQQLFKTLTLCMEAGADVSEKDGEGNTPLHTAVSSGNMIVAKFLLEQKADPDVCNNKKYSPIHFAVNNGAVDMVKLLLDFGACCTTKNNNDENPADIAKRLNMKEIYELVNENITEEVIKFDVFVSGKLPVRYGHATKFYKDSIYIVGGCNHKDYSSATIFYDTIITVNVKTKEVEEHKVNNPRKIAGFSITSTGKTLYVTGGITPENTKPRDLWSLDMVSFEWSPLQTIPQSVALENHQFQAVSRIDIVFLLNEDNIFNNLFIYDTFSMEWRKPDNQGKKPIYREGYTLVQIRNQLYMFGGKDKDGKVLNDFWQLSATTYEWKEINSPGNMPCARYQHNSISVDNMIFITGGFDENNNPIQEECIFGYYTVTNKWLKFKIDGLKLNTRILSGFLCGYMQKQFFLFGGNEDTNMYKGTFSISETTTPVRDGSTIISLSSEINSSKKLKLSKERPKKSPRKKIRDSVYESASKTLRHSRRSKSNGGTPKAPKLERSLGTTSIEESSPVTTPTITKRRQTNLIDHVSIVEEYTNTLCADSLHFITLLQDVLNNPSPENIQLLKSTCEELEHYCSNSKPPLVTDISKITKAQEKEKMMTRFEKENFPYSYYQSIDVDHEYKHTPPSDFDSWSSTEKKRYHIFNEIVQTETLYVHDLSVIIGIFMKPLQNEFKDIVDSYQFSSLFKNTETLLELNKNLLRLLKIEQEKPSKQQDIGNVFLSCLDDIEAKYIIYSANQIAANETYVKLSNTSQLFVQFCNLCKTLPECKGLGLDSYLIKPFQRVCRYSLLLKELDKQTPSSWPTASNIHKAKKAVDVVVGKANESKRAADTLVQALEIQNRFVVECDADLMQLHKYHFIKETNMKTILRKKPKTIVVFLFKELLLLALPSGKILTKHRAINTSCIVIYDIATAKQNNEFSIVDITDNFKIDVIAPSEEIKKEWIDLINSAGSDN